MNHLPNYLPTYTALFTIFMATTSACGSSPSDEDLAVKPDQSMHPGTPPAGSQELLTTQESRVIWVADAKGDPVGTEVTAATAAFLDGQGLADGTYYYQVTDPLCRNLLAGPGAESVPDTFKKPIEVIQGKFTIPLSMMPFVEWYEDSDHAESDPWTYKVWLTRALDFQAGAPGCFGFDESMSVTTTFVRRIITNLADGSLQITDDLYYPVTGNVFPSADAIRFYAVVPSGAYRYQITDPQCRTLLAGPNPDNGAPDTAGEYVNSFSGRLYSPVLLPFGATSNRTFRLHITPADQLGGAAEGCFGFLAGQSMSVDFAIQ